MRRSSPGNSAVRLKSASEVAPEALYIALGFPIGLVWFCVFVTLLSLAMGLMPILIGLVVLVATLRLAGGCASWERRLAADLLGRSIDVPERKSPSPATRDRLIVRILDPIADGSYWRELVFLLLRMPLGIGGFVLLVMLGALPLTALAAVVVHLTGSEVLGVSWSGLRTVGGVALTVLIAILGPTVVWAYAHLQGLVAEYLVGPSAVTLSHRLTAAETRRDQSVSVAEAERRRIERDLHDGAQARLATVALDLGRAKRKLQQGADPEEVAIVIESARADAKPAIVELRNLARGIHPAVLTDRGLDAALSEVAARSQVPVSLHVELQSRPSAATESAAYFAVCELLNNINRHSSAEWAWVVAVGRNGALAVEVGDDGVGGVDTGLGTGVNGLRQRIESLGGTLTIDSPLGSGTTATIELPMTTGLASSEHGLAPEVDDV